MTAVQEALAARDTTAVEAADQAPRTPVALLNSPAMLEQITESLPRGMDPAAFKRHAITLVKQTPKLMECEATSVAQGIVRGAALGLDPDPALGQMWLVPRNVKQYNPATRKDEWSAVATFQVGYRGLHALAMRSGRLAKIEVRAVHEHDHFEGRLGSRGGLDHQPDWFGDRGPVVGWYAYALLKDGTETFEVLSVAQAEEHRDRFAPRKSVGDKAVYGPWVDHFEAMAQKTVFIKLAKWLPKSVELDHALDDDGKAFRQPLGAQARPGDVIEAHHTPQVEAPELPAGVEGTVPVDASAGSGGEPESDALAMGGPLDRGETAEPSGSLNDVADQASAATADARNKKMHAMAAEAWNDRPAAERDLMRKHLIASLTNDRTRSSKGLTAGEWDDLFLALDAIKDGTKELWQRTSGDYELRTKRRRAS